jgi:hypothetical protein
MADRFLFEPLDIVQLAVPSIDNIDIDLTARNIRIFRASGSKRSYNPVVAHAEGFASGATSLEIALAGFDAVQPDWWKRHLRAGTEGLHAVLANNGSTWIPLGRKPLEVFDDIWFKPAIRGAWKKDGRRDAALINLRYGIHLSPARLSFLSRVVLEFHLRDEPNLSGLALVDLGRHQTEARRIQRVLYEHHVEIMDEAIFVETLKQFVFAARVAGTELRPREMERVCDLFRVPRFQWPNR